MPIYQSPIGDILGEIIRKGEITPERMAEILRESRERHVRQMTRFAYLYAGMAAAMIIGLVAVLVAVLLII